MARFDPKKPLRPTLMDLLTDPDSGGTTAQPGYTLEKMMAVVQRDLEDLMNTRQTDMAIAKEYPELHSSLFGFGLPDLTSFNAVTYDQRAGIGRTIAAVIQQHEMRLKEVEVKLHDEDGSMVDRKVKFHINAKLNVDPAPEVAFDTVLELTTGRYSVQTSTTIT